MALTELQQPSKSDFYANLRNQMSSFRIQIDGLKRLSEFLERMDTATLDNMGVPASGADEGLRQDLVNMRTAIDELLDFFNGVAQTQTQVPTTIFNKIRGLYN